MAERRKLIAGNWKMNGLSADGVALARSLADRLPQSQSGFEMLICPPATLIAQVRGVVEGTGVSLGGQDCHPAEKGAFTGDISAEMLRDLACRYVIVGHSERRHGHGEQDELIKAKAAAAHRAGLVAIVCVGETESERTSGQASAVVGGQVAGSLPESADGSNTVLAYEPVWAIGTGRTAMPEDVDEMHAFIRRALGGRVETAGSMRILYGGSVKANNARELLAIADVDGALVGGASLNADEFWAIAHSCG
jgi:triosephosphate isomerase